MILNDKGNVKFSRYGIPSFGYIGKYGAGDSLYCDLLRGDANTRQFKDSEPSYRVHNQKAPKTPKMYLDKWAYYTKISIFGQYNPKAIYYKGKTEKQALKCHLRTVKRRSILYEALNGKVIKGDDNPLFREYLLHGRASVLKQLKKQYNEQSTNNQRKRL